MNLQSRTRLLISNLGSGTIHGVLGDNNTMICFYPKSMLYKCCCYSLLTASYRNLQSAGKQTKWVSVVLLDDVHHHPLIRFAVIVFVRSNNSIFAVLRGQPS